MNFLHLFFVLVLLSVDGFSTAEEKSLSDAPRSDDGILFSLRETSGLQNPRSYFHEGEISSTTDYSIWRNGHVTALKELYDRVKTEGKKLGLIIGRGNKEHPIPETVNPGTVWVYNSNDGEYQDPTSSVPHIYGDLTKGIGGLLKDHGVRFDTIMTDWEVPKFFKTYDLLLLVENLLVPGGTFVTSGCKGWKYASSPALNFDHFKTLPTTNPDDAWYVVTYRSAEGIKVEISDVRSLRRLGSEVPRPAGEILALASLKLKKSLKRSTLGKEKDYSAALIEQDRDTSSSAWVFVEVLSSLSQEEKTKVWEATTYRVLSALLGPSFESCHVEGGEYPYPGNLSKDPEYEGNKVFSSLHCTRFKSRVESLSKFH